MKPHSCIYEGTVSHRRKTPVDHQFCYRLFLMYVDLDELDDLFSGRWFWSSRRPNLAWFRRQDHFGNPGESLAQAVRRLVQERTEAVPRGPIRMLTHFRYFGFIMNPISLFYCFGEEEQLEFVVAEVNNTPWGERHCYVLDLRQNHGKQGFGENGSLTCGKDLHVSPFLGMHYEYVWRLSVPASELSVGIENRNTIPGSESADFHASLQLKRVELTRQSLSWMLCRYPFMTLRVFLAIYRQAFRLWRLNVPYVPHPKTQPQSLTHSTENFRRLAN